MRLHDRWSRAPPSHWKTGSGPMERTESFTAQSRSVVMSALRLSDVNTTCLDSFAVVVFPSVQTLCYSDQSSLTHTRAYMPPPPKAGQRYYVLRSSIRCLSIRPFSSATPILRDAISFHFSSKGISMKLAINSSSECDLLKSLS